MLAFIVIAAFGVFCVANTALAQPALPRNVEGRVFANSSNGVQNGIPVRINSTASSDSVLVYTDAPDVPELRGTYSLTIQASNGEEVIGFAWNSTHFGSNTTTIQGSTTELNIVINMTRQSEANVTIMYPPNNSLMNVTSRFMIFANISMLGNNAAGCNATIAFFSNLTLNITEGESLNHSLGDISLGSHRITNWTVYGRALSSANFTVRADCSTDEIKLDRENIKSARNITFQNIIPQVSSVGLQGTIDLLAGQNLSVFCNATIIEPNSAEDLSNVNATLFLESAGNSAIDDYNYHYTNNSCQNISEDYTSMNYSCGFKVAYYASNGTWKCNVSARDIWGFSNHSNRSFAVNELMAIEVSPSVIDHGNLKAGNISQTDANISVRNIGNIAINASVRGFAPNESMGYLNLSMACPIGNISNDNHRYAINNGTDFAAMQRMDNISRLIPFSLHQRTDDFAYGNDTNMTYWKVRVPALTLGMCNGTVFFKAVVI